MLCHGSQCVGRNRRGIRYPGFVESHARHGNDLAELVFYSVVRCQHNQAYAGSTRDSIVDLKRDTRYVDESFCGFM